MIGLLKDSYGLQINEDHSLKINIKDVLENNFNLTDYNITIPTFNIFRLFP